MGLVTEGVLLVMVLGVLVLIVMALMMEVVMDKTDSHFPSWCSVSLLVSHLQGNFPFM